MTGIEDLDRLLDETAGAPLSVLLDRLAAAVPNGADKTALIESMVDESRADWQWLLSCPRGRILLLSGSRSARVVALARHWDRVVAAVAEPAVARALRRVTRALGRDNVTGVTLDPRRPLPFRNDSFDAVYWSDSNPEMRTASPLMGSGDLLHPLFREIARILKCNGQVYLGLRNRWRLRDRAGAHAATGISPTTAKRLVAASGLDLHGLHARENLELGEREIVDLGDEGAVSFHLSHRRDRIRHLPAWLYRFTVPDFAIVAGLGTSYPSRLQAAVDAARKLVGATDDTWRVSPPVIRSKGKMTIALMQNQRLGWLIKIPLQPQAAKGQQNGQAAISALLRNLPIGDPLRPLLPARLDTFECEGLEGSVEAGCTGRPWFVRGHSCPPVSGSGLIEILRHMATLDLDELGFEAPSEILDRKTDRLAGIVARHAPEHIGTFTAASSRVSQTAKGRVLRLRKGDFTLSNIFIQDGRVSGLIDWDDTEVSELPLAIYADFIFSWLWQRRGWKRKQSLACLVKGELEELPLDLAVHETLERLGVTQDDLATAALASWLDHADQELRYPVFRYQPGRVEGLLLAPCRALTEIGTAW